MDLTRFRIALAGNPNCGKTTLFNALTGLKYKVANYPGVTVEKKSGRLKLPHLQDSVTVFDLPGIYSLSSTSIDEKIATQCLTGEIASELPNLIVCVLDATNLERNLYLLSQLIDCGIPIIVALNMCDIAEKRGIKIYAELLSKELDLPVVPIIAKRGKGIPQLIAEIELSITSPRISSKKFAWSQGQEELLIAADKLGDLYIEINGGAPQSKTILGLGLISEALSHDEGMLNNLVREVRTNLTEKNIDPLTFEATARYRWIQNIITSTTVIQNTLHSAIFQKLDAIMTNKVWGTVIFILVMAIIFQAIFLWSSGPMDFIDSSVSSFGNWVASHLPNGQIKSLIVDGVIAGVGSVLVFVPQIAILFFFLGLLEDSGYLSRAAFLMDGIMRTVGLQGRSFIPLLSSFACAIPGILSTRTIPSWADRLATIMVAPLMSCSARLPVYAVLISAFIPQTKVFGFLSLQGLTLLAMYILGILGAAAVAWILKKTLLRREPAFFVMELPPFRRPSIRIVVREVFDRIKIFLQSAGTIILACSIMLWFLASYPRIEGEKPNIESSYAGQIGKIIEPVIKPLGYNWEVGVGLLASFAAREVFVSALATIYNVSDEEEGSRSLIQTLKTKQEAGSFLLPSALSLMVFYVFACQCMSTLAVCKRETGSWRWVAFMFVYMTGLAYLMAYITYRIFV